MQPVCVSRTRIMLSLDAEAMERPSGEHDTDQTDSIIWPRKGSPTGAPESASHTRTVRSSDGNDGLAVG